MNEERELLERWVSQFGNLRHDFNLLTKTKELLAQPEPIKEREILGKIISTDDACNWNLTVDALKDYDHVYVNGIRYTEYQPDINTQYLLDQVSRLTAENAMLKEKWLSQPEQEEAPVATKLEGHQFTAFHVSADDFKKLQKLPTGTKIYTAPPKREPLSDKEITDLWANKSPANEFECVRLVEKAHGIGCAPLSNEQKRLEAIAIKQREAHGFGGE